MPILNIRDMGSHGVNSDVAPWELPPGALTSGVNFRMSSGKIQSAGGLDLVGINVGDTIGHIASVRSWDTESRWIVMGQNGVYLLDSGNWVSISSGITMNNLDETLWSSCQIGRVTFMNHPDLFPIYWVDESNTVNQCLPLPWDIDGTTTDWQSQNKSCRVIASHKNFLFALGMKEGLDEYRDKVWWSHPAEPDGVPLTWKPTSERRDSIAGWVNLGRGGAIVGGESLRDSFVIYSEEGVNVMDYVGDSLGWRRRSVSTTSNLVSNESVVEVKGAHYFIGRDDIMMFDGNSMQSIVHNRLRSRMSANVNNDARTKSWAAHYESFNEIWFAFPSATADLPDIAYVYNYRDGTFGIRHLEEQFAHGRFGDAPSSDNRTWDSMTENGWDSGRGSWAMGGDSPFNGALFGASGEQLFDLDPGVSSYKESNLVYSSNNRGDFTDWTHDGTAFASTAERLQWSYTSGWDRSDVWAYCDTRDFGVITTEFDSKVRVTVPTAYKFQGDCSIRVTLKWNDVEVASKTIVADGSPTQREVLMFEAQIGEKGNLRVEFTDVVGNVFSAWIHDVVVESLMVRTETMLSRRDIPIGGHEVNTTITRIYPLIEGTSPVQIRLGSAQKAGGEIRWAGDFQTFIPGVDRKLDIRTTGETHAYEIKSSGRNFFDMTGMDLEFSLAGSR